MPAVTTQRFDDLITGHNDREIPSLETYPRVRVGWPPAQDGATGVSTWVNWAIASNHIADALAYRASAPVEIPGNIPVSLSTTTQTSTSGREWVVSAEVKVENYAQLLRQLADEMELGHVKVTHGHFSETGKTRMLNLTLEKQEWTSAK